MTNRHLIINILNSAPYGNPNRDDSGAPKTAEYGGTVRGRWSSQSTKRSARTKFETVLDGETTMRSTLFSDPATVEGIAARVKDIAATAGQDVSDDDITKAVTSSVGNLAKNSKKRQDQDDTLMWFAAEELDQLADKVAAKLLKDQNIDIEAGLRSTPSLTISAFGRMFANAPGVALTGAVQVAHAITTHETSVEVDYFTAVDDLRTEDKGAGYLNVNLFTSGVYYRHLAIDPAQLRRSWTRIDEPDATDRVTELIRALLLGVPTGKENTAPTLGLPEYALAVEATSPLSFANAFEQPVRPAQGGGYVQPSIDALNAHVEKAMAAMPSMFSTPDHNTGLRLAAPQTAPGFAGVEPANLDEFAEQAAAWVIAASR